ncbi:hypothetical protein [Phaeacidiphilus oryzae]|uniref:hypothetical protein n=1 Tax=Phaeacidiphilus oryzae TaxID=348818 RepID=UPI000B12DBC7|nr:hypothetical protein [Phaeacidiphilus oryzae]
MSTRPETPVSYFLSAPYPLAPTPGVDPAVDGFHRLLSADVAEIARLPRPAAAGRLNLRAGGEDAVSAAGAGPAAADPADSDDPAYAYKLLDHALLNSRVLVPLFCEEYFRNDFCGKEWQAFAQSFVRPGDRGWKPPIVPVLWRPVPAVLLPRAAEELEFEHARIGAGYASDGMLALGRSPLRRAEYRQAVRRLADLVVASARSAPGARTGVVDLENTESAFDPSGMVRLLVAALPDGPSARLWGLRPPQGDAEPPDSLIHQVRRMLEGQGYGSVVDPFVDPFVGGGLPPPPHPDAVTVLLIDPWALDDPRLADLVREFVAREVGGPLAVLVPWSGGEDGVDGGDADAEEDRRRRLYQTLEPFLSRRKPQLRSLPIVVTDPGALRQTLAQELRRAADQLEHSARGRRRSDPELEPAYDPAAEQQDDPPPRLFGPDPGQASRW